jgi:3-oxoacyl-(acyl-carrier-protein) synthase
MELKRCCHRFRCSYSYRNNVQEYWNALVNGSGAAPITYFDASKFKTQFACRLKNFNVEDFIDRKKLENGPIRSVCNGF